MKNNIQKLLVAGTVAAAALGLSEAAMAQVRVGVNIGVPVAPVYVAPQPVYVSPPPPPPAVVYAAPPAVYAPTIAIGWYGGRYYDGHRYWTRDENYRYHGNPHHYDHYNHHG